MSDFPITALRSVDLFLPDLAKAEFSLPPPAATGADHHVLALHQGPAANRSVTFRAAGATALAAVTARAAQAGGTVLAPASWRHGVSVASAAHRRNSPPSSPASANPGPRSCGFRASPARPGSISRIRQATDRTRPFSLVHSFVIRL